MAGKMDDEKKKHGGVGNGLITRRDFMKTTAGLAAAASLGGLGVAGCRTTESSSGPTSSAPTLAPSSDTSPEAWVKHFYRTLTEQQKRAMCFDWHHSNRTKVSQNWQIVEQEIGTFYTADQQYLLREIFKGLVSPDGHERFMRAFKDDAGGFEKYTIALFGDPETDQFEWVMAGRHLTLRCAGQTLDGVAFGGPMFYGHATGHSVGGYEQPDHAGNVWWKQALLANKVYSSLDGKQRAMALLDKSPGDDPSSIQIRKDGEFQGVSVAELSRDQRALVQEVMKDLLAPYRESEFQRTMKSIEQNGGLEKLHLAFYQEEDLGNDGIWDRWMIQGPSVSWFFRGSPHVHTWVNVVDKAPAPQVQDAG